LLSLLINELRTIAMASGNYMSITNMNDAIHYEKAQNILEATAGDVLTAAQLYWDDYLATLQEQQQQEQQQHEEQQVPMAGVKLKKNDDVAFSEHRRETMGSPLAPEPEAGIDRASIANSIRRRHRRESDRDPLYFSDVNPYHIREHNPPPEPQLAAGQPQGPTNDKNISRAQGLQRESNKEKKVSWEFDNYKFRRQDRNRMKHRLQQRKIAKAHDAPSLGDPRDQYEEEDFVDYSNPFIRRLHLQQLIFDFYRKQDEDEYNRKQEEKGNYSDMNVPSGGLEPPHINDNDVTLPHGRNNDDSLQLFSQGQNKNVALLDDDDDDEIIVRRSMNSNNSKHRLQQYLRDSNSEKRSKVPIIKPISVKRRRLTQRIEMPNDDDGSMDSTDDDEDDYLSDNDWMWESLANMSSWSELSPISLPMGLLWGGSHSVTENGTMANETNTATSATEGASKNNSTNSPNIFATEKSGKDGRTKIVVKVKAQFFQERLRKKESAKKPTSSLLSSIEDDAVENGKPIDEEDNEDIDDEGNTLKSGDVVAGIPRTWMSAGFHLVKTAVTGTSDNVDCATTTNDKTSISSDAPKIIGLAVLPPNENDFTYNMWKTQQTDSDARHATIPLPYHCRSITALLSIVTGLMYTGATVENGGHVSCTSSRQPLQELDIEANLKSQKNSKVKLSKGELMYRELSESDRLGREYEARLVDALTALLRIAAEASMKRKTRALQVLQTSKDPTDQRRWLMIKRKLRLVPTCWWEVPPNEIRLMHTEMPKDDLCCLPIVVTYTNIHDLRSYVQGNIRAFTATGGCALFLETIARIHGKGALSHMIRRSRKAAGYTGSDVSIPLLCCKCTQRHHKTLDDDPILAKTLKVQSKKGIQVDTTPPVHSCMSTELLSLLLVGRVHSTLHGWSAAPLGLGILSNTMNEVGRGLTRPEKPVWILRGPTCYSVMWLNGCSDHVNTFARIDHSGTVAAFTHWNCWHNDRNAAKLRLVTDRSNSATSGAPSFEYSDVGGDNTMSFALQLSHRRYANERLARDCNEIEMVDPALLVSSKDIQCITVHPDDPGYYPNLYRMWRYDMSDKATNDDHANNGNDDSDDRKPHVPVWKSYHSLNDHEKHVIETKLGPQICTVLWTRWPRATVDRFVPNDSPPVV
jgi:hypothetical protein